MAKFDLSKIMKDLNIEGLVSNVKSMIHPEGVKLEDVDEDPVAKRIVELTILSKHLSNTNAEMSKQFNQMSNILEGLLKDLQVMKEPEAKVEGESTVKAKEVKTEETVQKEQTEKSEEKPKEGE